MNKKNRTIFENRLKSFLWRSGMMVAAFSVAFLMDNVDLLELGPFWTTTLGLFLGEVSKYLNANQQA